jgi:hypothetical protein
LDGAQDLRDRKTRISQTLIGRFSRQLSGPRISFLFPRLPTEERRTCCQQRRIIVAAAKKIDPDSLCASDGKASLQRIHHIGSWRTINLRRALGNEQIVPDDVAQPRRLLA